jgi:hypothetical protein
MFFFPIKIFQLTPGTTQKARPRHTLFPDKRLAFLSDGCTHGKIGVGEIDQIDSHVVHTERPGAFAAKGLRFCNPF